MVNTLPILEELISLIVSLAERLIFVVSRNFVSRINVLIELFVIDDVNQLNNQ